MAGASFEGVTSLLDELRRQIAELRAESAEMEQLLLASERQAGQLEHLYVATYQLHASLELETVRRAICEIGENLLGASEYALLGRDEDEGGIRVDARTRDAGDRYAGGKYAGGDPLVDHGLATGVVSFGPVEGSEALAVLPLMVHGTVIGALVILALLPQKAGLGMEDRELLDVLAAHAASALLAGQLFHERTRKLRTLEGLMGLFKVPGADR